MANDTKARRMAVGVHDRDDVMQDAFWRILKTLPTERGELAERTLGRFDLGATALLLSSGDN
jgi:hypothetical protein